MEITTVERLLLLNQYEILKRLSDSEHEKADYDLKITALSDGYDTDFQLLMPHLSEPIRPEVQKEVRDILEMFRALGPKDGARIPAAARFLGFDGNDEAEHYAYAAFLLEDRGLWKESHRDDYNTHNSVLPQYREMLELWNQSAKKFELSAEETKKIVAKAPYGSVNP